MAKDRLSPLKENILPTRDLLPMGANRPANYLPNLSGSVTPVENDFMPPPAKGIELPKTVTTEQLYEARRFPVFNPEKTESDFAYGQSLRDKAVNGILKGANLAATTVAGGFATLYGVVKAPFSGRLADIWDNEGLRSLDKYNNEVDNYILPNYYTDAEKNSAWYSTDNWMTANFLFDKLIKNSGFAVGAMVGGNIANAGLLRAGSALGKLAGAGALAAESSQAFKLFTPLLRNTARAFSAGKNIEAAAILEKEISSIADLAAKSSKLAELGKLQVNLANFNDTARRYAIAAYSSAGEASFEALQTANEYRNKLIEKYKSENYGAEPPKEVLDKINADSEKVGRTSFFGNLALLSITESVQLPYLLGSSYKNSKQVANSLVGKVDDVTLKGAKYVAAKVEPTTVFGKIYKGAVGASKYVFDPKEAGQEIGQYALQVGTQNYFKKANESEDANILTDGFLYGLIGKDEFGKEVGALISKEGIESGILGGITGGLMQARRVYAETKAVKNNTKAFLEELNSTPSFKEAFQDKLDSSNRGVVLQQQYEDAIKQGDKLEAQDLKADMMHNYLATRIKYGRFDMVMDDIQELRSANINDMGLASLKEQGLANINDTTESFQKRLNNLELVAKNTEQLYKAIDLRYSGEILKDEEGKPLLNAEGRQLRKYSPATIDKMVYAASKIADYDVRIPQVNALLSQNLINTFDVLERIIEEGKPNKTATQEALSQINKLDVTSDVKDVLKTQLSDVIELSLRRKLFIEEYDDIKKNPLNYTYDRGYGADEKIDTSPAIVKQKEKLEGEKKSKIVNAELTIGKEYSLKEPLRKEGAELQLAPKITVLSKTLGGEFEVKLPNGKIKFLTPNEFKNYSISDTENASPEFTSILNKAIDTVLNKEEYSKYKEELATGKPEDVLDRIQFINSLDDQNLINDVEKEFNNDAKSLLEKIEKEKVAQEGLLSQKEVLDRELAKLAPTAGSVESVPSTPGEVVGSEDKRPDVDRVFLKTISPSEDLAGEEVENTPFLKRSRYFLNNFKFFKNRNKIKVIIVTDANAKELGLDGIIQLSYNLNLTDALPEMESDVNQKFMAQVFITQTPEGDFFVNEKGEKLSKVGEQSSTILDNVVFQKMTSASLTTEGGYTKIRKGQELEAEIALEAYKIFREGQFKEKGYTPYPFAISRGIANQPKVNGVYEDNHMSDILGPNGEEIIAKHNGLLEVVIDGKIVHDGETLSFPIGTTLVKYGDLLDFANNKTLTAKQANNTFGVINALAKDLIAKSGTAKAGKPNFGYITFLKNVLFFKFKEDPTSPNQIRLDTTTMEFKIGDKSFPLSKIEERKQEMIEALQKAFISINNKTLKEGISKQFTEYVVDKDGNLTQVIWPNYQSFLMSGKNPDGSSRSVGETPLITHTTKPTDNKNSYKQKYAYITNRDVLPYSEVPAKKTPTPAPTTSTQGVTKVGPYEVNTTTPQTFPTTSGPVLFTATFKDGVFNVTVLGGEGIESISTDPIKLKAIDGALKRDQDADYVAAIDNKLNEDKVKLYLKTIAIPATLKKESETQQAAPVAPQQAPVVSDIEAKKDDIEKRRQKELFLSKNKLFANVNLGQNPTEELLKKQKEIDEFNKIIQEKRDEINAKYDAELAALEGKPAEAPKPTIRKKRDSGEYRKVGEDVSDRMTNSELEIFKQWHAEKVPFIPFEVLDNMVTAHDGTKAWGVFEEGVAKFVRGGLRGTEYHEIGHGIWTMLSAAEQEALLNEFRSNSGTFKDRESGKQIEYAEATDKQAEERIWDDFSDYRLGKLPARSLGERVRRLFKMVMDFFKSFVAKPSLKEELFKAIDSGKFKETKLSERAKTLAPKYRAIEGLTEAETNGYIQDMVFQVKRIIFRDGQKELLFNPEAQTGEEVFSQVRQEYEELGEIEYLGEERYNELVKKSINFLRTLGISFNADEVVSINDENANSRDYAPETFSIDWKKNSTGALKFLLSTLSERQASNQSNKEVGTPLVVPPAKMSDQGFKILNFNRVFATLLDRLHNTNDPAEFTKKFIELAKEDSNYLSLFTALGGNLDTHTFDFDNFGVDTDWRLFIQFFNTFSRQKPEALIQYVSEEGEVYTGPANIYTTISKTTQGWIDNMKTIGKSEGGLISFTKNNKGEKVYKIKSFVGRVEKSGNTWKAISPEGKVTNHSTEKEAKEVAKSYDITIKKSTDQIKFLNSLGIEFDQGTYNGLSNKEVIIKGEKTTELDQFVKAVIKIQTYLGKNNELMTFDAKRLDIGGPLRTLATLHTKINNPNQDSTYFGVEGQRIGSFSENNAPSYFENTFNESTTLDELLEKMPQLNDVYSRGSEVLKKGGLFFNAEGERIATLNVGYIQGTKNQLSGKDKSTAKLSRGERFVQEINQNINGNYYVLIPGDSSTEWMMNLGNVISMEDVMKGDHWNKVYNIYSNYLNDEINLALEDRTQNLYQRAKSQELRIMKDILPEKIVDAIESMIKDGETYDAIQDYISKNREAINSSVKDFIDGVSKNTIDILINTNQINMVGESEYYINAFDTEFLKKYNLTGKVTLDELMNFINFANINYQINNQEYHKILFGDPYQFKTEKGKLDETKRIKSFLSGRRRTFDMVEYNNKLKEEYNTVDGITLEEGMPGYHEYKEYTNTVTFANVDIVGSIATLPNIPKEIKDAFAKTDETDAMSWLMDNTHKEIALKEGQWPKQAEDFHQWHMAYTRQAFLKKNLFKTAELKEAYENSSLNKKDAALILKDIPKHKLAVRKPIISGNKNNKTELDIVLDKTSQMPIYYHMVEGTSLGTMYEQMFEQNIGYAIVISGRKVGAEDLHSIYADGKINTAKFGNIIEVPWKIYGTQVETMSEGDKSQTRGSQPTKIVTSDLYDNGEPIGATPERKEFIAKAVKRHDDALDMLNENGYNELLNKLGVVDLGDTFALENKQAVSDTLMYEMMRRELSENAIDTIQLDENGEFIMPFEASPSYAQIKSILYSLVRKALTSPQMSGSPHVQVPVTMFEKATEGRSFARKIDGNWVKISKAQYKALTEEEKKSVMLTDDTLKFYTEDDPYCEILLPHWFKNKFSERKFKTDEQSTRDEKILKYLNTPEGRKILTGIGFRIPTQSLSSIEVFRVKDFLPEYMGSTVVVPSEITTKAGSDFDIDKLNMYLKSVYVDKNGNVRLVKYLGTEEATKEFYGKVFDDTINIKAINKSELLEALQISAYDLNDPKNLVDKYDNLLGIMLEGVEDITAFEDRLMSEIEKLGDENLQAQLRDKFVRDMYTKSLENEYYESIEELVTLPENFNKLISPVNDAGLEKMSEVLDDARGYDEADIKGRLINRNYMTNLRHAFITGKRWVGIAAVNITNLSLRQKAKVYLDPSKLLFLSGQEGKFVKDLSIVLPHNKITIDGKTYVSLSGTRTADLKQLISERYSGYATAFVDIANKPFITKIIKSDTVVSTFMFLEAIGAGDAGIYFLNQPIIEKYLEYLDGIGSKSVMGKDNLSYIRSMFPTTEQAMRETSISVEGLLDNIREYSKKQEFYSDVKNAEQQLILNEFIKYKILADQLFSYTQATNYDTTKFGSSDLYLKKELGTISASNFNLISNVNDVLKNTFIGKLSDLLGKSFDSFGAIMKTEDPKIRAYMIDTIKEYATRKYMTADDYLKMANLINNSFLDYIIQNDRTYYNLIKPSLVDSETAVVSKLEQAKQKYPSIQILQELVPALGNREDGAQSIELKANVKDAYSENLYTGMMRELRDIPELNSLYNDIVNVAILQGVGQTAISIRNIIPVEDYAAKIKPIIDNLYPNIALESYSNGMFQRNNFNNEDVFSEFIPYAHKPEPNEKTGEYDKRSVITNANTGEDELVYFLPSFGEMKGVTRTSRRLLILNDMFNYLQLSSDYIKIPKVITNKEGIKVNVSTGVEVTKADYARMKQKGSQDLYDNYYYKKVYTDNIDQFGNRIPLRTPGINKKTGEPLNNYYYKLINVYGDGPRAVEYNTNFTPSVINNGSMKIKEEINDRDIVNFFAPQIQEEVVPLPTEVTKAEQVSGEPKGVKVKEGVYVNQEGLTKDEQLELFDYLKPFLEEQAAKTNKGAYANKMIGLGLRWDYKSNNSGPTKLYPELGDRNSVNVGPNLAGKVTSYGYYDKSINGLNLEKITPRFRELITKATGVDISNYDGAIINLYDENTFIGNHADLEESISAKEYPVVAVNIGGSGNFTAGNLPKDGINLKPGAGYLFGIDGVNRTIPHSTLANKQDGFLPEITTKLDGKVYEPGSYRVTITMRRVMPLEPGMPSKPNIVPLQEASVVEEDVFTESLEDQATRLKQEIDNARFDLEQLSDTMPEMIVANNFNKISPESARRETGANTGNKADISTSLLSNNGVSVEKAAENIWDDNFADNPVVDAQDVRNIIIDILSSGSIKNYKESILENSTIKELKQQYNAVQEQIKAGKETIKETKEKLKASQMSLFDKNAPEGLPEIDRSNEQCS